MPHVSSLQAREQESSCHLPVWLGSWRALALAQGLAGPLLPAPPLLPPSFHTPARPFVCQMLSILCSMSSVGMGPWGSVQQASVLSRERGQEQLRALPLTSERPALGHPSPPCCPTLPQC